MVAVVGPDSGADESGIGTIGVGRPGSNGAAYEHPARIHSMGTTAPSQVLEPDTDITEGVDTPWVVIVWNDPINLMSYVAFVLRKLFGHSREKAHKLMMQVHTEGKAVVSSGTRSEAERDVFRLHEHGLWATMQQD